MFKSDKTELKILMLFVAISSLLAFSMLIMGYYAENKFETIAKLNYVKKNELLFAESLHNSLDDIYKKTSAYAQTVTCSKLKKINSNSADSDFILLFSHSSYSCGLLKNGNFLYKNPLGFIPQKNNSGIIKIGNRLYLYKAYKFKNKTVVFLKNLLAIADLQRFGKIIPKNPPEHHLLKNSKEPLIGLYRSGNNEHVVLFDIFNKPVAIMYLPFKTTSIFKTHYKIIFHIIIFTLIAIIISGVISYVILKNAYLDDIRSIINSIKGIRNDFAYVAPRLKNRQFQQLTSTIEWLIKRIKESEYLFNKVLDLIPIGIIVYKATPVYANKYAMEFFGENIIGTPLIHFVEERHKKMLVNIKNKRIKGENFQASYTISLNSPDKKVIQVASSTIEYKKEPAGLMAFMDVTENEKIKKLHKILNSISDTIVRTTSEDELLRAVCLAFTLPDEIKAAWINKKDTINTVFDSGDTESVKSMLSSLKQKDIDTIYTENRHGVSLLIMPVIINRQTEYYIYVFSPIENFFNDSTKPIISQIGINIGLSIEHIRIQKERTYMLFYDTLTNLKNFNSLTNDIKDVESCVLIYINIENFSLINQIYGFAFSNKILKNIGRILRKNVKAEDSVYRLHTDKFAILIKNALDKRNIEKLTERLKGLLVTFELDSRRIPLHANIGITIFPNLTKEKEKIIESAEVALINSKSTKSICFYSDEMEKAVKENFELETYTRKAIEKRLFFFHYQPILNLRNGKMDKAEALIRLKDEQGRLINTEKFISTAEKTNIISELSKIVIEEVFGKIRELDGINISINLSSKDIANPEILSSIENNIKKYNLSSKNISIELTERDIMYNFENTKKFVEKIRGFNMEIEIDDFGIGYSSFDRIVDLDFDILKIDKSLIDLIGMNKKAEQIIIYIIKLAHSMNAKALAEGIENKTQFEYLADNGCDYIQGYYISKPLPIEEFKRFIKLNQSYL